MALAEVEHSRTMKGPPCTACALMRRLQAGAPLEAAVLDAWLRDDSRRFTWIAEKVNADPDVEPFLPEPIDHRVFGRHARGDCAAKTRLR